MKARYLLIFALFTSFSFAQSIPPRWDYRQPEGPNQWGNFPGYATCAIGADQSPIDIESGENALINVSLDTSLEVIRPNWASTAAHFINNGHTVQVNYDVGSDISFEGNLFNLKQFHFHSPSEHILDGREYPLEAHFVHQSSAGTLVVGVFFEKGSENSELAKIWKHAPPREQSTEVSGLLVSASDFLPSDLSYYHYTGSLTTPPCTEGVKWIVLKKPIQASVEQLRFLQHHMGGSNNRPIQPLDGRLIGTAEL